MFFRSLLKQAFHTPFGFQCPRNLYHIRDLSFLPHLMRAPTPWRHIQIIDIQRFLSLSPEQWESCLLAPELHLSSQDRLREVGADLLNYCVNMCQTIPTRLKAVFAWNMNSCRHPKCSREDPKMRRIKKLLRSGPVMLQGTKWRHNQERPCFNAFQDYKLLLPLPSLPVAIAPRVE